VEGEKELDMTQVKAVRLRGGGSHEAGDENELDG
jgi:hypothetical protein